MNQDWNLNSSGPALGTLEGPKPTPRRFRKLLRREEENLARVLPEPAANEEAAASPETSPAPNGRDRRGRFTKGNPGGSGNPFARQIAGFRQALVQAVTPERFAKIADALIAKAESGEVTATKLLFSYLLGKAGEAPNPDRLALDDYQLLRERLSPMEHDWHLIRKMVPVEGIIEAGHRVADLRAASWREDVLGTGPKQSVNGAAGNAEQAVESYEPSPLLLRVLAALDREPEEAAPSANGVAVASAPSANGVAVANAPSANGVAVGIAPSTNGVAVKSAPSANGVAAGHGEDCHQEVAKPAAPQEPVKEKATTRKTRMAAVLIEADRQGVLPGLLEQARDHPLFQWLPIDKPAAARPPSPNGADGGSASQGQSRPAPVQEQAAGVGSRGMT